MCRNIRTLFNFEPPATELEIRDAALQFVRKISGFTVPSRANEAAFDRAVEDVAAAARTLISSLVTTADRATGKWKPPARAPARPPDSARQRRRPSADRPEARNRRRSTAFSFLQAPIRGGRLRLTAAMRNLPQRRRDPGREK